MKEDQTVMQEKQIAMQELYNNIFNLSQEWQEKGYVEVLLNVTVHEARLLLDALEIAGGL